MYAVGHPKLTREGIWLAAVKACGPGAALSHQAAPSTRGSSPSMPIPAPVHVTVPGSGGRRKRNGIIVHRSSTLTPADIVLRDRIPMTKPARTLANLKPLLPHEQWDDALTAPASSTCQSAVSPEPSRREAASSGRCSISAAATACRCPT